MKKLINFAVLVLLLALPEAVLSQAGADPQSYSISTPRPINPAASTTNPSALATEGQNPYLGASGKTTAEVVRLSLHEAVERGLRYNLGLIESNQASAEARAQRPRRHGREDELAKMDLGLLVRLLGLPYDAAAPNCSG